jgi:Tol biopolymer transport system component
MKTRATRFAAILLLLAAATGRAHAQAAPATGVVTMPRGPLAFEDQGRARNQRFTPTDRALSWLPGDSLLVAHLEVYGTGFAYFVNCMGSGFFKVPVGGGTAVAAGDPFCALQGNPTATPDGEAVLFFGEPLYARRGAGVSKSRDAALLRYTLATAAADTLKAGCGSGYKDASISKTGRIAWTGPCREPADLERDASCRTTSLVPPPNCSNENHAGVFSSQVGGRDLQRVGGPTDVDAHDPAWSPDGKSLAFSVGANPLSGRWEVSGTVPGNLMIASGSDVRDIGVAGEAASWSPDGTLIAYYGDDRDDGNERYGGPRIYLVRPDGSEARRVFLNEDVTTYSEYMGPMPLTVRDGKAFGPLVWSPDGRWLVFSRQYRDGASLWRVEVETGRVERLTATG